MFDWGTGCGHALAWTERIFGVRTTGHELVAANAKEARRFTGVEKLCTSDGSDLSHLPDAYVDHVISNAAIIHLAERKQCALVVNDLLRILRPGGTMWLGWNAPDQSLFVSEKTWRKCLERVDDAIIFDIVKEVTLFGTTEYFHEHGGSSTVRFWPRFSVFIVKLY